MTITPRPDESNIPENRFGIADQAELQRLETAFSLRRLLELQVNPIDGRFDAEHLRAIHRYIFQDIYGWAGQFRDVNISKGTASFPPPEHLKQSLDTLFVELKSENWLKDLSVGSWAHRAAYFLGEINAIHPFREGNGRTQREFVRELALTSGHALSWAGRTQREMIHASQISFMRRDYSELEKILINSIRPAQ